jgi:hypothetical protein
MATGNRIMTGWKHWTAPGRNAPAARLQTLICVCLSSVVTHAHPAETNVAPYSKIRSTPYVGAAITYLTDGKLASPNDNTLMLGAPLPIRAGEMPLQYEFSFPQRVRVAGVRLFQHDTRGRRPASGYVIELDTEGNRHYPTTIVTETRGRGGEWIAYRVSPPVTAFGLRFRTTHFPTGPGPNYGAPAIEEFEIFSDTDLPIASPRLLPAAPVLEADLARAKDIKTEVSKATPREDSAQFRRGVFGSMWLYWSAGRKYSAQDSAGKIALLQRLKVNRYWLYPGVYVPNRTDYPFLTLPANRDYLYFIDRQLGHLNASGSKQMRIVPFSSGVVPGYRDNVLAPFVAQMHKAGVRVIANESLLPYGLHGWDFPRVTDPKVYPSVLSSSFVRDASTTLYKEYMEAGIDGLALGGDEFFLYGAAGIDEDASPVCKDADGQTKDICKPTSKELFKQRFGIDPDPSRRTFSPLVAKWTVFKYEQLARLFANYAQMMKTANPDAIVTSIFRPGEENRPAYGIAYDVMGSMGAVTEMSSNPYWSHDSYLGHYYFANETKKLIGASRVRTAAVTLQTTPNSDRNGYRDPMMVYGPAFSALMHGARGVHFYKQDYLFADGKNDPGPWVEKFFNLTAFLESKGLFEYRVPKAVALLYSRASEDWWQLAHAANPVESAEATLYQNAVMEALFRSGIPFDLYYLDQPSSLDEVSNYAVAILPYPYSIGTAAVAKIRDALNRGTKIVSLQRKGEVDEFGNPYQKPALDALPGLDHLTIDLARSNYVEFSAQLMPMVLKRLGGRPPLTVDSNGKDVECAVWERRDSRWVFCLNWERQVVDINLGLSLAEGTYTASVITLEQETPAGIGGKSTLAAADLERFRLVLAPGEVKIVSITPVGQAAGLAN